MSGFITFEERLEIESMVFQRCSFGEIAKKINKDRSTISREIRRHSITEKSGYSGFGFNACVHMEDFKLYTCCFFGHRKIDKTPELIDRLTKEIEVLITEKDVNVFYFGSKSEFDDLCHKVVTELKEKYPNIKRIYVRSAFQHIPDWYEESLLEHYEGTYFPNHMEKAGKASYVERNQEMINKSDFCVIYYDENYLPPRRKNSRRDLFDYQPKSGTAVAYDYAVKKKKKIINCF